jgi:hypothetical protein
MDPGIGAGQFAWSYDAKIQLRDRQFSPKYYFQIIDLSVCLPIITALQFRCEISSHSPARLLMRSIGERFAHSEEMHD